MCTDILISLTNSMQHSPSPAIKKKMEAQVSFSYSLQHKNSVHSLPSCFFKILCNIIHPSKPRSSMSSASFRFSCQNPAHIYFLSHTLYMPMHLILLDLITWTIFCEQYRSWSALLRYFPETLPIFPHSYAHISAPYSWTSLAHILRLRWQAKFHGIKRYYCDLTKGWVMAHPVTKYVDPAPLHHQLTLLQLTFSALLGTSPCFYNFLDQDLTKFCLSPQFWGKGSWWPIPWYHHW